MIFEDLIKKIKKVSRRIGKVYQQTKFEVIWSKNESMKPWRRSSIIGHMTQHAMIQSTHTALLISSIPFLSASPALPQPDIPSLVLSVLAMFQPKPQSIQLTLG